MKIVYEPHPVSPERKAELRAQGCKIVDKRFEPGTPVAPAVDQFTPEGIAVMEREDVVDLLKLHGAHARGKLPTLRARLTEIMFVGET